MGSPVIRVGITATTAPAEAQIKSFADSTAAALARTTSAQAAFSAASAKSAAATIALDKAFEAARASGASFTEAMEQAVASLDSVGAATTSAAASTEKLSAAHLHLVPQMAASSAAIRVFEGTLPIRAVERFIGTTLGLGPALQSIFPIIGAIAFAEVIGRVGKEVYDLYEKYISLDGAAKELADTAAAMRDKDFVNVESIETATRRLDEANTSAGNLLGTAQQLHDISFKDVFGDLLSGNTGAAGADIGLLVGARKLAEEGNKSTLQAIALTEKQLALQHQLNDQAIEAAHAGDAALAPEQKINAELEKRLALAREAQQYTKERERAAGNPVAKNTGQTEEQLEELSARREAAAQRIVLATRDQEEAQREADRFLQQEEKENIAAIKEHQKAYSDMVLAMIKANDQALADSQRITDSLTKTWDEQIKKMEEEVAESAKVALAQIDAGARTAESAVNYQLATGGISKLAAAQDLAAIHTKEYADKLAVLNGELKQYNDLASQGADTTKQSSDVQSQISTTASKGKATGQQDAGKISQDLSAPYVKAVDTINGAWLQMQNKLIFGTRNVSQAFANMGVSILQSVAQSFEKMLAAQLKHELQSIIIHQTANTTKVASDATAAAAGDAIKTTSALKENFMNAKTAATGAFKGVMSAVPPPLNFILAPVAAAAAFAGTLAVGAFEKGGMITAPTLALMGESGTEAVLPNRLTTMLMNVANGGNSTTSTSSTNLSQTNNFSGISDRDFQSKIRKHSAAVADAVGKEMRGGRRK